MTNKVTFWYSLGGQHNPFRPIDEDHSGYGGGDATIADDEWTNGGGFGSLVHRFAAPQHFPAATAPQALVLLANNYDQNNNNDNDINNNNHNNNGSGSGSGAGGADSSQPMPSSETSDSPSSVSPSSPSMSSAWAVSRLGVVASFGDSLRGVAHPAAMMDVLEMVLEWLLLQGVGGSWCGLEA